MPRTPRRQPSKEKDDARAEPSPETLPPHPTKYLCDHAVWKAKADLERLIRTHPQLASDPLYLDAANCFIAIFAEFIWDVQYFTVAYGDEFYDAEGRWLDLLRVEQPRGN